jgi:hypothetical protein
MIPAFGAGGVGVLVLLYLLLFGSSSGPKPIVVREPAAAAPTVVVQPMVPSVLGPVNPAGASVQEVAATAPVQAPNSNTPQPTAKPTTSERTSGRRDSSDTGSSSSGRRRSENGTVVIGAAGGWADVFLGSRRLGTTPVVATLPPGTHTLTVYPFGKGPAQRSRIEVKAGEQIKHKLTLGR